MLHNNKLNIIFKYNIKYYIYIYLNICNNNLFFYEYFYSLLT